MNRQILSHVTLLQMESHAHGEARIQDRAEFQEELRNLQNLRSTQDVMRALYLVMAVAVAAVACLLYTGI